MKKVHFMYCLESILNHNKRHYNVHMSKKFCAFFAEKFEEVFIKETGIKPSHKVTLGGFKQRNDKPMYESGLTPRLNLVLWIMPDFYDDISFCWRYKSEEKLKRGEIVATYDEEFDENELEYWIEGLKPALYWKQISTEKQHHPFHIKNLPYTLKVYEFGTNMGLSIKLSDSSNVQSIIRQMDNTIDSFNTRSEKLEGKYGFAHSWLAEADNDTIELRIDTGSAGVLIIRELLRFLAKYPEVVEVKVDL